MSELIKVDKIVLEQNELNRIQNLSKKISDEATKINISNDDELNVAIDFGRGLKAVVKEITNFFKTPKSEANKIHKQITGMERECLEPLKQADSKIRKLMADYENEKRKQIQEMLEAEAERREREADRLLKEAEEHRKSGDEFTSLVKEETALNLLETPKIETRKVDNLSIVRIWKARVVDPSKVPIEVNGMEIRPVSMSALNNLARASKGKIKIDGVEFYEEASTRIRS